jgi:hypothetical protein
VPFRPWHDEQIETKVALPAAAFPANAGPQSIYGKWPLPICGKRTGARLPCLSGDLVNFRPLVEVGAIFTVKHGTHVALGCGRCSKLSRKAFDTGQQ